MTQLDGAAAARGQGFAVDPAVPLFVFMGRLDAQKGVDVLFQAVEKVLEGGLAAQFVFMGSGIEELEEVASDLEARFPAAFKAVLSFKGQEKYKTYAAGDFALMPSRYEPCGLVQVGPRPAGAGLGPKRCARAPSRMPQEPFRAVGRG